MSIAQGVNKIVVFKKQTGLGVVGAATGQTMRRESATFNLTKSTFENNEINKQQLQKINRYFISNDGIKIVKCHPDGREIQVEAGKWKQTIYNNINDLKVKSFDDYNIKTTYYLNAIYKEITNVNSKISRGYTQIELF